MKFNDLTGQSFGKWTVLEKAPLRKGMGAMWLCRCGCGVERVVRGNQLTGRRTAGCRDCGVRTHGHWVGNKASPENAAWHGMLQRVRNPKCASYGRYGGRGITVCERWLRFESFLEDMGLRPSSEHSLDRINSDGNYEPGNCRWATVKVQNRNRSFNRVIEFQGEQQPLSVWAERAGIIPETISQRIRLGWPLERALTEKPKERNHGQVQQ